MSPESLKAQLKALAQAQGFEAFGVASAETSLRADYLGKWLADGCHGSMAWMARAERSSPKLLLPACQSVIVVGLNYHQTAPVREGQIATYALGTDYHKIIPRLTKPLVALLEAQGYTARPTTDTAPVMEKPLAAAAGIGWQGKSTMCVSPNFGPWMFLATILTDAPLEADAPSPTRCGSCHRCLDACPTGALTAPYCLDARRCVSYLTIEHEGAIEPPLMEAIGDHLYGCDACLGACPWSKFAPPTTQGNFAPWAFPTLLEILSLTPETFTAATTGTPLKRLGLDRLRRNACIVLGNIVGTPKSALDPNDICQSLSALACCAEAPDYLHTTAAWALEKIAERTAR